jgi:uncharacterized membrane protein
VREASPTVSHAIATFSVSHLYPHLRHSLRFLDHVYVPVPVVLAALAAAACYAIAAVLQQSAATEQRAELSLRPGLLFALLRRPRWLLGNLAGGAGFAFQFLALRRGSLALVEPLLVVSLVIALPLSAISGHRRLGYRDWAPAVLVIAALALFLLAARPGPGFPHAAHCCLAPAPASSSA